MVTGKHIAETARNSGLLGTPYKELDCQALVEKVLHMAGLNIINYRGSNHMWRELVYDRTPIVNASGAGIPLGALVFIVKHDGGEVKRGYHDSDGNATHVGIYVGDGQVFESTTGGVQYGNLRRFTDSGLIKDVSYDKEDETHESNEGAGSSVLDEIKARLTEIKTRLEEIINDIH